MVSTVCLLGACAAGIVWLNLYVRDFLAKMTPEERARFEAEVDEDMRW